MPACFTLRQLLAACLLSGVAANTAAQYQFLLNVDVEFGPKWVSTFQLNEDDSIVELRRVSIPELYQLVIDPRGQWIYCTLRDFTGQFYRVATDGSLQLTQVLADPDWRLGDGALRPDGLGIVLNRGDRVPESELGSLQHYFIDPVSGLMPSGASFEYDNHAYPQLEPVQVMSQRGSFTLFGKHQNRYRTYHVSENGDVSPPSSDAYWTDWRPPGTDYFGENWAVSRDGRVLLLAGFSVYAPPDLSLVSHWVGDDGSVTIVDRVLESDVTPPPGGNASFNSVHPSVFISPDRSFAVFQGKATDIWSLNPDGTFAGRRDIAVFDNDSEVGLASLSGDGRVLIVTHAADFPNGSGGYTFAWGLRIFRLSPQGDILSETVYVSNLPIINPTFITRREPGDANGDGWIDVADLVTLVNHVYHGAEIGNPVDLDNADVNRDGARNKIDVVMLTEELLGR